jgi:dipeptidyl aminopeptidase/acylaminoacyl peptidase
MRTKAALLIAVAIAPVVAAQTRPSTPSEIDVPKPVGVQVSLAGAGPPDIARFLNVRSAVAPSLSPDGRTLAFRTAISGTPQLWTVSATGGWPTQLTFGESVTFHQWSPAGDWIAYGTDRGGDEREGYYLIAPDGTRERELLAPSTAFRVFGGFTRDGRQIAYATTGRNDRDFDVHLIDVVTATDRELFRGRMGLYVVSWHPDARFVILSEARGEDANDVYLLDVTSGAIEPLFKPSVASSYQSFSWLPDGSGFYLSSDEGREFAALCFYDLRERRLKVIEAPAGTVDGAAVSASGRLLAWTVIANGYSTLRVRDLTSQAELRVPELPAGRYEVSWAPRADVATVSVSGPQVPGDIWVWDTSQPTARRATESSTAGLDMHQMAVPEHHSFAAPDGTTIHGLLYRPRSVPAGARAPVLLSVHGGPSSEAAPRFNGPHQYLLARGIAVLDLNYRGSTGYGKTFARLNDRRLRVNELLDLRGAVDWLRTRQDLDARRVAIMGGSYGGYLTMAALTRLPDVFAAGVAFVGVSNWVTALQGASPQLKASDRLEYGDIDDPAEREFFAQLSPVTHVREVRAPAMVIHGANDPRDPVSESDQFVRGIRERGGRVEYLRFPDEGHGIRKLSNRLIAYRRIAAFLEASLDVSTASKSPQR